MSFEFPPNDADPRKRHLRLVQWVFEGYHEHTRNFLEQLDREGPGLNKVTMDRLIAGGERMLASFGDVIAMLRNWETADGLEAMKLAVVLELVTAVDKLTRQVVERAKVLALTAEEAQWEVGDYLADDLRKFTKELKEREKEYRGDIAYLQRLVGTQTPGLCELDLDVMAWGMEDNREILTLDIARIRAWMKEGKDRDAAGLAAVSGCEVLLGLCGEVVRLIAMLRGHTVDRLLVAKPGAPTAPVN